MHKTIKKRTHWPIVIMSGLNNCSDLQSFSQSKKKSRWPRESSERAKKSLWLAVLASLQWISETFQMTVARLASAKEGEDEVIGFGRGFKWVIGRWRGLEWIVGFGGGFNESLALEGASEEQRMTDACSIAVDWFRGGFDCFQGGSIAKNGCFLGLWRGRVEEMSERYVLLYVFFD